MEDFAHEDVRPVLSDRPRRRDLRERWTPLIIRNLHLGCETFGEILEGAPGLSHTLLAERLHQLERLGIVEVTPKAQGRGHRYLLTMSGDELFKVCESLGEWGARWLEIAPENLDPFVALWSMCNALRPDRLPARRVVVRLDFVGFRPYERYWLLLEHRQAEICKTYTGLDEDLFITADAEAFVKWHAGRLSWAEATGDSRIQLHGPSWLVRDFPTWNGRSMFAHITPAAAAPPNSRAESPPSHSHPAST
ncbi:winged helix-turn-helix transcriptional regulator [Agromyces sp. NPDC058484]|uniref:winged helix-turn-helix transcriptional regulator n=1 Tax=Agromyces sp. NPDC058484 TaxID=3346524 RepID=UPI003659929A